MPEPSQAFEGGRPAVELSEFEALLNKEFKPRTANSKSAVATAVKTLAEQALSATALISDDAVKTIQGLIAEIDKKLSEQINLIIHHEDFKSLEGTWRGLAHLVNNTETDENLKIRVLNISKKDLGTATRGFRGTMNDRSPLFKKIYENEFGRPGGQPFGVIVGDFYFDHTPMDVDILTGMAQIASAAHAPFISGAAPSVMNLDSWQELHGPPDLTRIIQTPEYAAWNSLRHSEDTKYIGLAMPRFLSRLPYGFKTSPVEEFDFEEDTGGADNNKYVWSNSAYAMAANITRAFKLYGWCARICGAESGGMVEGLPCRPFPTDDGGVDMKCPTEIAITQHREAELATLGFLPLSHWRNADFAVFVSAQSLHKPASGTHSEAANNILAARLPCLFPVCRFAHYLQCMARDKIGSYFERADLEQWFNSWISDYVITNPNDVSEGIRARKPLSDARVSVKDLPERPGYHQVLLQIRPNYQLEGLMLPLQTALRVPSPIS